MQQIQFPLLRLLSNLCCRGKQPQTSTSRVYLSILAALLALLAIWPLASLLQSGIRGVRDGLGSFGLDGGRQICGTLVLLLETAVTAALLGTANGWLLVNCHFPLCKLLRVAQLIPLATPAYLLAATLVDLGSQFGLIISGMGWSVAVMVVATYPYVFLLSTESFAKCSQVQLEACRTLGVGPWSSFRRVALPISLPAIGAGVALMGMEVVNELGAVELLGIPTLSAGILQAWQADSNPEGAIALAFVALVIMASLLLSERRLRQHSRRWTDSMRVSRGSASMWVLRDWRAATALFSCALPPLLSLGLPLVWATFNIGLVRQNLRLDTLNLTVQTLGLGLTTTALAVGSALILSIAKRWDKAPWLQSLTFLAGLGYAIPGTVLALALLIAAAPLQLPALLLLVWGYADRFLAISKGALDAALERLPPSLDEAATSLNCPWPEVLRRIHLPLLRGPLAVGGLLVFVDTIKELPLTFALRPFDFDTLAVRVFQYAGDERLGEALIPALMILVLGLLASASLVPELERTISDQSERSG
ncbi:iron ABC transporter permease [cyanobiont of Ornithocercus magnificus]|nr:iron ABC transporter permease [cyanobiont of Ornithocercus magnificus]